MSSAKTARRQGRQERAERAMAQRRSNVLFGVVVAGIAVALIAAIAVARTAGEEPAAAAPSGSSSGSETVLGVASDVSLIELGRVPLNQTVEPTWILTNFSDRAVKLEEAHAEVLEGCCPGPLEFTKTSLKPGETARLVFPLQMHEGMDGPHDFDVHVPITSAGESELMTLKVTGDFSA